METDGTTEFRPFRGAQTGFYTDLENRITAFVGGLGSGKTTVGAAHIVMQHRAWPGTDTLCIEPTCALIEEVMLPALEERLGSWGMQFKTNNSRYIIDTPTLGSRFFLKSGMHPERITGFTVGRTWIDEPGRMPASSNPMRDTWKNALQRTRDPTIPMWARVIRLTGTHEGTDTWYYRRAEQARPDEEPIKIYRGSTFDNPLMKEYAASLEAEFGPELARQYVYGEAAAGDISACSRSLLLKSIDPSCTTEPDYEAMRLPGAQYFVGIDVGRKASLTVIWVIKNDLVLSRLSTAGVVVLRNAPFADQDAAIKRIMDCRGAVRCCMDAGYNQQTTETARQFYGSRIEPCYLNDALKRELAEGLAREMQMGRLKIPEADSIIDDLASVKRVVSQSGIVKYMSPYREDGHSDRFWAAALAVRAARGWGGTARAWSGRSIGGRDIHAERERALRI